jgi:hypothetical protein
VCSSDLACTYTKSKCSDGKTYAISCTTAGECTCSTDGANGATFADAGFCKKSSTDQTTLLRSKCGATVY